MKKKSYKPRQTLINARGQALRNRVQRSEPFYHNIVISGSGGKDSAALSCLAKRMFPKAKLIAVHAQLDTDWKETEAIVIAQYKKLDIPLTMVRREDGKGLLDLLIAGQVDRKTKELKEKKWPGSCTQWCTSQLKIVPLDKFCRELPGNTLVLIGERAQESIKRTRKSVFNTTTAKRNGKTLTKASIIYDWSIEKVWAECNFNEMPKHPCYDLGVSRASCAICIYSSKEEIAIAAKHYPELVKKYLDAEKKIGHKFRYNSTTKKSLSISDILKGQGIDLDSTSHCDT